MAAAKVLLSFVEGISSELGSLSVPYIQFVFCFNIEKRKLMNTLSTIRAVLLDADKQQEKNHADEDWLDKLQVILYDAEDLVEDLSLEVQPQVDVNRNMADKVLSFFSTIPFYIVMAFKMKTIRERLNDVAADRTNFHPMQQGVGLKYMNKATKETHAFVPANKVIGREGDKRAIKELLKKPSNEENVSIIPIIGIGGVGKTTLAQMVYNDEEDFILRMWVWDGSIVFNMITLVKKLIQAATNTECPNLEMDLLQHRLREILDGKKYLLVLDDVWNTNSKRWNELKDLLMGGARGSMILVTTRDRDVAQIMGNTASPYELSGLFEDDCRSLFKQVAFKQRDPREENPGLLAVGEEILKKCGGIPLAIRTVAGLLFLMDTESEWLNVKNQLWKLAEEDNDILPTLRVSYEHLPPDLKKCFAYCSLFPKGSKIKKATFIQLWMAQGFIQPSKNRLLEDIGDEYFKKLWKRSFFQDEITDDYGNVISCKMHDLMHDLAQTVAGHRYGNVISCKMHDQWGANTDNFERVIHASVNVSLVEEIPTSLFNARKLRIFFMTGRYGLTSIQDFDKLASNFKCLRALYFGGFSCSRSSDVLNSMGELKRLRYLDLSHCDIVTLPNSVCELQHLQTLKLNYCRNLTELPRDIKILVRLRYLENRGCDELKGMPSGLGQLTCIQTLSLFVLGSGGGGLSELQGLKNLRGELKIKILKNARNATPESGEAYLKEKQYLQTLTLEWKSLKRLKFIILETLTSTHEDYGDEDAALLEGLHPNHNLKELNIWGYGGVRFPSWMVNMEKSLPNLVKITLNFCPRCEHVPLFSQLRFLKVLQLESLNSLEYIGSYIGDSSSSFEGNIPSGAGGWFPALKEVILYDLPKLKEWRREVVVVNDGGKAKAKQRKQFLSLNSLTKLTIYNCPRLTSMPLHPHVKELKLDYFSGALIQSMTAAAIICPTTATTSLLPSFLTLSKLKSLEICNDLVSLLEGWLVNLTSLEHLEITHCASLESLSRETFTSPDMQKTLKGKELDLTELKRLRYLDLSLDIVDCNKLTSLPRELQHLEELVISNCLRSLQSLKLSGLPMLVSLPKVLQHATALKNLKIEECPGLMTLPDWFGNLTSLRQLTISDCNELKSLPEGMRCFTALQELIIWKCPYLLETCRKETGKDWPKIAHIPKIQFHLQVLDLPEIPHIPTL